MGATRYVRGWGNSGSRENRGRCLSETRRGNEATQVKSLRKKIIEKKERICEDGEETRRYVLLQKRAVIIIRGKYEAMNIETPLLYQYLKACSISFLLFSRSLEIRKVLSKLCKEKGSEWIAEWVMPCENHLFWSATTAFSGNGQVIWAKFRSFMSHIINKYSGLSGPLFNSCFHGVIQPRKWLKAGMYWDWLDFYKCSPFIRINDALGDLSPEKS